MVLSIISIMATIALPSYFSMRQEGMLTKAQKEINLIQSAVENYLIEKEVLPSNIDTDIFRIKNSILSQQALDPWKTDGKNYGYQTGKTQDGADYYVIYSKGLADKIDYQLSGNMVISNKNNIMVSNLPIISD